MATAAPRQLSVSCHLCRCEVTDSKYLRKLGTRTSECATAALDGLCQELDCRRMQLVQGPVCRSCFQDLEKLRKAQTTVALLKARFVGCLRARITSTLSPKDSTSRKRSASDSLLTSSTPRSRPPAQKRPVVYRTEGLGTRLHACINGASVVVSNANYTLKLHLSSSMLIFRLGINHDRPICCPTLE